MLDWLLTMGTHLLGRLAGMIIAALVVSAVIVMAEVASWSLTLDQIIAIIASCGTVAAAIATYLTVREMRAGRVLSARARLTTPGTDQHFVFHWRRNPKNSAPGPVRLRIVLRNASQGVAHNIRIRWLSQLPLTNEDLKEICRWLPDDQTVRPRDSHAIEFLDGIKVSSLLPISGDELSHVGDLGPNQETFIGVPETIANMAFMMWLHRLLDIADGGTIDFKKVPLFKLILTHNSPYQKDIQDVHFVRFELADQQFKYRTLKSPAQVLGGRWTTAQITLAFETTSRNMYETAKVVV